MKQTFQNKIKENKCFRCGHTWIPRKKRSIVCPKCKTPYWNIKKEEKKNE